MTTATTLTPSSSPVTYRSAHMDGRQTLARAVRAEWIKLTTLRSTWVTTALTILITAGLGALVAIFAMRPNAGMEVDTSAMTGSAWTVLTVGTVFGEIVVAVLGALIITGEYSSGQIRSSLAAVPRRTRLFAAKAAVVAAWSFVTGVVSILLAWAMTLPFLDAAPSMADSAALGFVWGTGLAYAGIALMALGLGFLMRSTAGSITVMTVLLFVAVMVFNLAAAWKEIFGKLATLLPSNVIQAVTDPTNAGHYWKDYNPDAFLTHAQACGVFALWVIVPVIVGWVTFSRRDA